MTTLKGNRSITISFKAYLLCFSVILFVAFDLSLTITQCRSLISKDDTAGPLEIKSNWQPVQNERSHGIHLIGERHSGTKWISNHLQDCFGTQVPVRTRLTRFKHWFQHPLTASTNKTEDYGVIISLVRNPYDWLLAMIVKPHHSLAHWNLTTDSPLYWKDFVTKPWTLDRHTYAQYLSGEDLALIEKVQMGLMSRDELLNVSCQEHTTWRHIIPCSESDRKASSGRTRVTKAHALYELKYDQSGQPYDSIIELRRDKILNFFQAVPNMAGVNQFIPLRYEDVVSQGSLSLIERTEQALGVKAMCEPLSPQFLSRRKRSYSFIQWVNEYLDWDVEALVGYCRENFTDDLILNE